MISPETSSPPHRLSLEVITNEAELRALQPEWDGLVGEMPRPTPFLLNDWLTAWWRHFGRPDHELAVHLAHRGDELVAALALAETRMRLNIRVARFLGAPDSTLADVVGTPEDGALATEPLVRDAVARHRLLDLSTLAPDGNLARFTPADSLVPRAKAPVLDLSRGWEAAYEEKTPGKRRGLHRRRWRQLREAGRVELSVIDSGIEFEQALEEAFRIHDLRWLGRHDVSTFSGENGHQFHREALGDLARRGNARIVLLRLSGRPIAFTCCLSLAGAMFLYRLGFDPAYARLSPGILTTHESIRVAADAGASRVEFLRGTERYKLELADRTDTLTQAVLGDGGFVNWAGGRLLTDATRLKRALSARRRDVRTAVEGLKGRSR